MRNVFDQHSEMNHNGTVTLAGGNGKILCLHRGELGETIVWRLVKTPCSDIIEDLRDLFGDLYLFAEAVLDLPEDPDSPIHKRKRVRVQESTQVQEATK